MGTGHNISLWFDAWYPAGRLINIYGFQAVYDSGLSLNACVSSVLHKGSWNWPPARFDYLVDIQARLPNIKVGEKWMLLFGSLRVVYTLVEKLGISLDLSFPWSLGGRQCGNQCLFPGMRLFCGWFLDRPLQLRRKCVAGALWGIPCVGYVFMYRNR